MRLNIQLTRAHTSGERATNALYTYGAHNYVLVFRSLLSVIKLLHKLRNAEVVHARRIDGARVTQERFIKN